MKNISLLVSVLRNPVIIVNFSYIDFNLLISQARSAGFLGRLHYLFKLNDIHHHIPEKIVWHFESANVWTQCQRRNTLREVDEIKQALVEKNIQPIFLKGSAYYAISANCCHGRILSDIDVLVDKKDIKTCENLLFQHGWRPSEIDDYDEMYYRKWMHEIPPMQHLVRETTIDLHHNILPLTSKDSPKIKNFQTQIINSEFSENIVVLSNTDIVIHSAVHLFSESEFKNGLRDLSDLDLMIKEFSKQDSLFVFTLIERAELLKLSRYVHLALRYCYTVLETPIPKSIAEKLFNKTSIKQKTLDFCFKNTFVPKHSSSWTWVNSFAAFLLYCRGHYIRMPARLLIPHLFHKTIKKTIKLFQKDPVELKIK